jgi:hypothetical protein
MKACGNMDVELHTFLTVAVDGGLLCSLQILLLLGNILNYFLEQVFGEYRSSKLMRVALNSRQLYILYMVVRPGHRWECSIKMDCKVAVWGSVDWIHLTHNRDHWQTLPWSELVC